VRRAYAVLSCTHDADLTSGATPAHNLWCVHLQAKGKAQHASGA
jgi:hypothetical protein